MFIACSWNAGEDGKSTPNHYARELAGWLEEDFGQKRDVPLLSVHVLEAATGESLARQVYARLREATLGITILTGDIIVNEVKYTKPNVYHELGYLMRHLDWQQILILREGGVYYPSNVGDIVYIDIPPKKLALCYREIVLWLHKQCSFVRDEVAKKALTQHEKRLRDLIVSASLAQPEGDEAIRRIGEDRKQIT